MEVIVHDGKEELLMRGADGCIELCWRSKGKDPDSGEVVETWRADKFYASVEQCLNAVANRKIRNSDAKTLEELLAVVKDVRAWIKKVAGL